MDYDPVTLKWLRIVTYLLATTLTAILVWLYGPAVSVTWADFQTVRAEVAAAPEMTSELSRQVIQTRRALFGALGELGFLLAVLLGSAFSLIYFAFSGKRHERSVIHERLAPHLQQYLDHSLGKGTDDLDRIPPPDELGDAELDLMYRVLGTFYREDHTVGSATKTFREQGLLDTYRRCYRMGFIEEQGDLVLTRVGRKARMLFRLELLMRRLEEAYLTVRLDDFKEQEWMRIPDSDVFVVNWQGKLSAVFGMDPTTGERIYWRRRRFRGRRSGNIFSSDGRVRVGPSEVGLTTFPVERVGDELRVDLRNPSEGELSKHRSGIGYRVWTGSSGHAEEG